MALQTAKRIVWTAICILAATGGGMVWAQGQAHEAPGAGLANMTPTALLGVALVSALGVLGYVVRFMAGKWMAALEANTQALQGVKDVIARCRK